MGVSATATDWEDLQIVQDVFGLGRKNFKTKRQIEARPRMRKTLEQLGWLNNGGYWVSPYTKRRYTERGALDVESLRGTFRREYQTRAMARWKAKQAALTGRLLA